MIFKFDRSKQKRSDTVQTWLSERLMPIDETKVCFLDFNDQKTLKAFAEFCHRLVTDREDSFTVRDRQKLYKRWLHSGQRCLMAIKNDDGSIIGCTIVLPLSKSLFDDFCHSSLNAIDIEAFDIESDAPSTHRYLLTDIMAFDRDKTRAMQGIPYRALLRHIAELYDPKTHGDLSIACESGIAGLEKRLQDLKFNRGGRAAGADANVYWAKVISSTDIPSPDQETYSLIGNAITDYRNRLRKNDDEDEEHAHAPLPNTEKI